MTSPYTSVARPSLAFRVGRAVFALLIAMATVAGSLVVAWIAAVTWTGCFISCSGTNHPAGAAIGAGALLILVGGVTAIRALYGRRQWVRAAGWTVGAGLIGLALVSGLS
jgi:hypothetical protein